MLRSRPESKGAAGLGNNFRQALDSREIVSSCSYFRLLKKNFDKNNSSKICEKYRGLERERVRERECTHSHTQIYERVKYYLAVRGFTEAKNISAGSKDKLCSKKMWSPKP